MADTILNNTFVTKLSESVNLGLTTPNNLSINLGFTDALGNEAVLHGIRALSPQHAIKFLFDVYVKENGTDYRSALNLRFKLLSSKMKSTADLIDEGTNLKHFIYT